MQSFTATPFLAAPKAASPAARCKRAVAARAEPERPKGSLFLGGVTDTAALSYLTGTLPGDKGFDPLGLLDPSQTVGTDGLITSRWLTYAEVIHCRWAMLGAAGCIAPELLANAGIIPASTGVPWFAAGVIPPAGDYTYWADSKTLFVAELALMGFAEHKRLWDYYSPGSQAEQPFFGKTVTFEKSFFGGNKETPQYPGGAFFNFANFGKTEAEMKKLKNNEIENGRLAMIAMVGYFVQAGMTGVSPLANLSAHLSDPVAYNITTSFGNVGGAL